MTSAQIAVAGLTTGRASRSKPMADLFAGGSLRSSPETIRGPSFDDLHRPNSSGRMPDRAIQLAWRKADTLLPREISLAVLSMRRATITGGRSAGMTAGEHADVLAQAVDELVISGDGIPDRGGASTIPDAAGIVDDAICDRALALLPTRVGRPTENELRRGLQSWGASEVEGDTVARIAAVLALVDVLIPALSKLVRASARHEQPTLSAHAWGSGSPASAVLAAKSRVHCSLDALYRLPAPEGTFENEAARERWLAFLIRSLAALTGKPFERDREPFVLDPPLHPLAPAVAAVNGVASCLMELSNGFSPADLPAAGCGASQLEQGSGSFAEDPSAHGQSLTVAGVCRSINAQGAAVIHVHSVDLAWRHSAISHLLRSTQLLSILCEHQVTHLIGRDAAR